MKTHKAYVDRLVRSLVEDREKWERKSCGASSGETWTEWLGPEYVNEQGNRIQFIIDGRPGAYVNGTYNWHMGFWEWINPFSARSIVVREAVRGMKDHIRERERKEYADELKDAL